MNNRRKTQTNRQKSNHKNIFKRFWLKLNNWFLYLTGVITIIGGIYLFWPHVLIQPVQLPIPENPFYHAFEVKNTGNIRILNFSYTTKFYNMTEDNGSFEDNNTYGELENIPTITAGHDRIVNIERGIVTNGNIQAEAQVKIIYKYTTPFIKIPFIDSIKFMLYNDYNVGFKWSEINKD